MQVTLFGKDKGGKYKVWAIETGESIGGKGIITIHHGQEGGKQTRKDEVIYEGKQGRNPFEQADSEAWSRVKTQIDKGYRENKADLEDLPLLAMLAGDYLKIGHRVVYEHGVDLSDKFDGVRLLAKCHAVGEITLESRTGQRYDVPHIVAELELIMQPGDVLDGELYFHGAVLQDITSAVKRTDPQSKIDSLERKLAKQDASATPADDAEWLLKYAEIEADLKDAVMIAELRPKLEFHVFDIPSEKRWVERLEELEQYAQERFWVGDIVKLTKYTKAYSEEEMKAAHKDAVARGYEGIMIRNCNGYYESGKRSADLQKYKEFLDSEFVIIDVIPDKDEGSRIVVKNDLTDATFTVTLGSIPQRTAQLQDKELLKGKLLTVKYQSRYKGTLLPQFPTGVTIRDGHYEGGLFVPDI